MKLIFERGDESAQLHLLQFINLLDSKKAKDLTLNLLKSQMPSGGFPSKFDGRTEGTRETCRNALLLLGCGIPQDRLNIQSATDYLVRNQREDGGWSENPSLVIPKQVVELSSRESITWLTADIVKLLRCVGLDKCESCGRALSWLREMQNRDGGWPMFRREDFKTDPDSTAQILFMMREIYGDKDHVWFKGIRLFESFLDRAGNDAERGYYIDSYGKKMENDIYSLTHLLLSSLADSRNRIDAGYDLKDDRVKKIVQAMLASQREDGGWRPFWRKDSDPTYTVLTLKLLVWLDVLGLSALRRSLLTSKLI